MRIIVLILVLSLLLSACGPANITYRLTFKDNTVREVSYYLCRPEGDAIACYSGSNRSPEEVFFDVAHLEKVEK